MSRVTSNNRSRLRMIKPTAFYSRENEKIKLNWFCYEFSIGVYDGIRMDFGKQLEKYGIDENAIVEFSIYISKQMKDVILQKLSGKIDKVLFSYEMIESYFPDLSDRLVDRMLNIISRAWDTLLSVCETCPTRCISEKDVYCTMFDEELYTAE